VLLYFIVMNNSWTLEEEKCFMWVFRGNVELLDYHHTGTINTQLLPRYET